MPRTPPAPLVAAARALGRGQSDLRETAAAVDRYVTSRDGFRRMRAVGYRFTQADDASDEVRLVDGLAHAGAEREASVTVADRVTDVGRLVTLAEGPDRRALQERLARQAPVTPGPSPYRPIGVLLTKHEQRNIELPVMGGVEVRFIDVNPDATDTLLLIHGHGARLEEYELLVDALGDVARVLVLDLPGSGYSDKPATDYSIAGYEPVIASFLGALDVSRCVVAGGGLGGNLTLRLALLSPSIVRSAVAWSVAGWGDTKRLLSLGARALAKAPPFLFWKVVGRQIPEQFSREFAGRGHLIDADLAYRREVYEAAYHRAYFHIAADQVGTSMLRHAGAIEPPVTLLAGARDEGPLGIPQAVRRLAHAMGIEAHLLDAGYALNHERPEELAEYIRAALGTSL